MIETAIVILWLASGVASQIYWVRNKYDYTLSDISNGILAAFIGPLAWIVGWMVYGEADDSKPKVLFKKRNK